MKIVWLSNIPLANSKMSSSGTWIYAMAEGLTRGDGIDITCISCNRTKEVVNYSVNKHLNQFIFPFNDRYTIKPSKSLVDQIVSTIIQEAPDIIHIWGTEMFWGSLPFERLQRRVPVLLDMQGFVKSVYDNFYGGLNWKERLSCIGLREFLFPRGSIQYRRKITRIKADRECRMLQKMDYVSAQSSWIYSVLMLSFGLSNVFTTKIILRPEFYIAPKWKKQGTNNVIFTTASPTQPLKGLLTLLKAYRLVSQKCPEVELHIAGENPVGRLSPGYTKLLKDFIHNNQLNDKVVFCGKLNTDNLIEELTNCSVYVNPSFVESYSLSLAEAMIIGVPCVASYVGAMPELGKDGESVLYFPKGDYVACADKILSYLLNDDLSKRISKQAIEESTRKHGQSDIVTCQIDIYNKILKNRE